MAISESEFIFMLEKSIIKYFQSQVPTITVNAESKTVNIFADYPRLFKSKHRPSISMEITAHSYEPIALGNFIGTPGVSGSYATDQWGYKVPFTLTMHIVAGSAMERRKLDGVIDELLIKLADGRGSLAIYEFSSDLDVTGTDSGLRASVVAYNRMNSVSTEDPDKEDYMSVKSIEMQSFYITLETAYPVSGFNYENDIQV